MSKTNNHSQRTATFIPEMELRKDFHDTVAQLHSACFADKFVYTAYNKVLSQLFRPTGENGNI